MFSGLFKIITSKNLTIASILETTYTFSWNFSFRHNLSDFEIENLESVMFPLTRLHLPPSIPNARAWSVFLYR